MSDGDDQPIAIVIIIQVGPCGGFCKAEVIAFILRQICIGFPLRWVASLDELTEQIRRDISACKEYFKIGEL